MSRWHILYQNPETARADGRFLDFDPPGAQTAQAEGDTPAQRLFASLRREVRDPRVIEAMSSIPRELFVSAEARHLAYEDQALPIGEGQTISQPLIVALMTSALQLQGHEKVLEVGAGSGYQAAILSRLARQVITVERHPTLAAEARDRLASLGIPNVTILEAGDELGYPPGAPYDAILVTAAAPRIPRALLAQLRDGGRIVIPVGTRTEQELMQATKHGQRLALKHLGACRFVPLIAEDAFDDEA